MDNKVHANRQPEGQENLNVLNREAAQDAPSAGNAVNDHSLGVANASASGEAQAPGAGEAQAPGAGEAQAHAGAEGHDDPGQVPYDDCGYASGYTNKELGKKGEEAAAKFLERKGFDILERNWTCPFGEADIICKGPDCVHFVEVKTRSGIEFGLPSDAVTAEKRARYEKIALCYLKDYRQCDIQVSFDIISILATGNGRAILRYHENAFAGADR